MSQSMSEMDETEFDALIDGHIQRVATGYGEMPADVFFDVLLERIATRVDTMMTLEIDVADGRLVITPDRDAGDVIVRGNEILVSGHRLVLKLARDQGS